MASSTERPRDISSFDDDKNTKLHFAAARGYFDDVCVLIERGHKINMDNNVGWTPLMMAARNGHQEVVKKLLVSKGDATRRNRFGASTLLMAVASGNLDILRAVLEHLLSGGVSKSWMQLPVSPLSVAILFNYERLFSYLVRKGFEIDPSQGKMDIRPSMFAALSDNEKYYKVLSTKGSISTRRNIIGDSAQSLLMKRRSRSVHQDDPNPCQQVPCIPNMVIFNPQPVYQMVGTPHPSYFFRKSSNVATPNNLCTPNMSPIGFYPQMFFPTDFSPSHPIAPSNFFYEDLNFQLNGGQLLSPMPVFGYQPPGDNV